ncbi:phosphotransferase [Hugonella massiliensis]|uniref:phosphotransferase n=1 Tax=Hugonella massiliensis TaxID=1720315 RepID=UPI00073F2C0D|nr:phosphotransferase [Hugonella massiliensis]
MPLRKNEFTILYSLLRHAGAGPISQRQIASLCGISLGTVNSTLASCRREGLIDDERKLTARGTAALEPYKVDNAIIMAAGLSSRFVPLSYEKPKGVLTVRGEVLIERQIRQLQEAGITDITVVVGYMKEAFFYLEDMFGVKIAVNREYAKRNNNSSLHLIRDRLSNTYICSSDDYFTQNPFEPYVYQAYYSAEFFEGPTDEYVMEVGPGNRIERVDPNGGADAWCMIGHAYFDRSFSDAFVAILESEYERPETAGKLWEDIYIDHLRELPMVRRDYPAGTIYEFDSIKDLREFDQDFLENVDSAILDNICGYFGCDRGELGSIAPIKEGLTNLSFKFGLRGETYVYRHPGAGTEHLINRASETFSQQIARNLGIDSTFVYEDPAEGWKLSRYVEGCAPFDYGDARQVGEAMRIARILHGAAAESEWSFDVYEKARGIVESLEGRGYPLPPDFALLEARASSLHEHVSADGVAPCLCHNDMYGPNFLVHDGGMELIDWEYSAMGDYASDLGTFICCSGYGFEQAERAIAEYFGREPSPSELRHCTAYVGLSSYYWYVWALFKESEGDPVGEWLYLWYRAAKAYGKRALDMYER